MNALAHVPVARVTSPPGMWGERVFVYWNLHNDVYSLKSTKTGKDIAHGPSVAMRDVTFAVGQGGRARVLREKQKNVHAGLRGTLMGWCPCDLEAWVQVTYNPYKHGSFVSLRDERPVQSAARVVGLSTTDGRPAVYAKDPFYGLAEQ